MSLTAAWQYALPVRRQGGNKEARPDAQGSIRELVAAALVAVAAQRLDVVEAADPLW